MAVTFALFDRWDSRIGTIADIVEATWTEELNGEDTLTITSTTDMHKGNRIVWCDGQGLWHEHIVASVESVHSCGKALHTATCENSISELYGDYVMDKRPTNTTCTDALRTALGGSRWSVGAVSITDTNSTNFYGENCRENVQKVQEVWGGELSTTIEVGETAVTARKVNLTRRGEYHGKRFTYAKNMTEVKRTFDADDVITALYGYGKGEEVGDGYGRRIDFADINGGKQYVEDLDALKVWGRPDGNGGIAHVYGKVIFEDCEVQSELLRLTSEELAERCAPKVSYEATVEAYAKYGTMFGDVALGDDVDIVDTAEGFDVRLRGRVTKLERDMLECGRPSKITIGNIVEDAADLLAGQYAELNSLKERSSNWDVAASTPRAYLNQVIDGLNTEFELGGSYKYESPEQGTIYSSVPLDDDLKPTKTPAKALQLKGGMLRISNKLNSDGSFNWRSFGDGDGFTADVFTAGTIRGGSNEWNLETGDLVFKQGGIYSADGRNYWNLNTGEFRLSGVAMEKETISSVDVEFAQNGSATEAPTTGWQTNAPEWKKGQYIWQRTKTIMGDDTYKFTDPVCISGRDGIDGAPGKDGINGADGKDGIQGPAGKDGVCTYFHRAYATSKDGKEGFSTTYGSDKTYLGTYVDSNLEDSEDPKKYAWSKIKGEDGANGIPGKNGSDGKTYYLHIAYAASEDGKTGFSTTPKDGSKYIGQCVDLAVADPETPESYTWSLIKGADGVDGRGISKVREQYYLSTSEKEPTGGSWQYSMPEWSEGRYYWTRSEIEWDDGGQSYSVAVLAKGITGANQNASKALDASKKLNDTVQEIAEDGIVTEAEKAAVAKVLQQLEQEKANLSSEYSTLCANSSVMNYRGWSTTSPSLTLGNALASAWSAVYGNGYAYSKLTSAISVVTSAETSEALSSAMTTYNTAYSNYSDKLNAYLKLVRTANDVNAQSKANAVDSKLTQQEIFNRLTNNGAEQGVYMSNNKLYINASYMAAGIIKNKSNLTNYWNLETGYFKAGNVNATGTFRCGGSTYYTQLNSSGQLAGYRTTSDSSSVTRVGYIDYSTAYTNLDNNTTEYGIQMQARGGVRISAPRMSVAATSNVGTTTTYGSTGEVWLLGFSSNPGNGFDFYSASALQMKFINGLSIRGM